MYMIAFILLILWSLVGSFDIKYYHDKKYSLYLFSESIREHLYHTVRATCYPIIVFSLSYKNFLGIIFRIGLTAIIIDTILHKIQIVSQIKVKLITNVLKLP